MNDEVPTFAKQEIELSVLEDVPIGHIIDLPVASDLDSQKFGISAYKIENSYKSSDLTGEKFDDYFKFTIVKNEERKIIQPQLTVCKRIDREIRDKYSFTLIALDTEGKKGHVNVILIIKDINDNSPQWIGLPYELTIKECTTTREIFNLKAYDADDPNSLNSKLDFKIDTAKLGSSRKLSRILYISSNNIILIDGALKGMAEMKLVVPLKVVDGGGLQNTTDLTISIKDCNDNVPLISITSRSAKIKENKQALEILTLLTVKDEDLEMNCEFSCHLNDTTYLHLKEVMSRSLSTKNEKPKRGMVTIYQIETNEKKSFDREKIDYYSVQIICIDKGSPQLTSSQQFNVIILDENDNSPIFTKSLYEFEIMENSIGSSEIGNVLAPDKDSQENAKIKYFLDEIGNRFFSINMYGVVFTKERFDREQRGFYNFTVIAMDSGDPSKSSTASVLVKILDQNDCKPIFKNNYDFTIVESYGQMAIHNHLGFIVAHDEDLDENGLVWYSIGATSPYVNNPDAEKTKKFNAQITKNGKLSLYGVIDREEQSTIYIDVIARDYGKPPLSNSITITVTLNDLNDHKPVFIFPSSASGSYVNISSDSEIGYLLAKLEAEDKDYALNGSVIFELVGNESLSPVTIERDGRVILKESIKSRSQRITQSDRILVRASDQSEESPQSEVGSLILRYIWPTKGYANTYPNGDSKASKRFPDKNYGDDFKSKSYNSNYIMILYCLAAVVFIIFLIVLCVLIYFYSAGRSLNSLLERKPDSKPHDCNTYSSNNQYFESIPFENNGQTEICNYPGTIEPQTVYRMQNHDNNYMQLMTNTVTTRCQTYTPINLYSSNISKLPTNPLNYLNSHTVNNFETSQFNYDFNTSHINNPNVILPLIKDENDENNGKSKSNKSKTISSILKTNSKSSNLKSHSLSSIDSNSLDRASKPLVDCKYQLSKDISSNQTKLNEKYISSSFV